MVGSRDVALGCCGCSGGGCACACGGGVVYGGRRLLQCVVCAEGREEVGEERSIGCRHRIKCLEGRETV